MYELRLTFNVSGLQIRLLHWKVGVLTHRHILEKDALGRLFSYLKIMKIARLSQSVSYQYSWGVTDLQSTSNTISFESRLRIAGF